MGARFAPLLAEADRRGRHAVGDRSWADETVREGGRSVAYVHRAIDQFGRIIDVVVSERPDAAAARRFVEKAIGSTRATPVEVVTDRAAVYPKVLDDELARRRPGGRTERYATNRMEAVHGRLKRRLRPMRVLNTDLGAGVVTAGHAFVQDPSPRPLDQSTQSTSPPRRDVRSPSTNSSRRCDADEPGKTGPTCFPI